MLYVHEAHRVMGEQEFAFEDSWRDVYAPQVAQDPDSRLLWYLNSTHGNGEAYVVITITGVSDGAAWERLVDRRQRGDLADWVTTVDVLRYGSTGSLMVSLGDDAAALADVPVTGDHDTSLYRYDTITAGTDHAAARRDLVTATARPPADGDVLRVRGAYEAQRGIYESTDLVVLSAITDLDAFERALGVGAHGEDWPGSVLDSPLTTFLPRSSRSVRTTRWSPLA